MAKPVVFILAPVGFYSDSDSLHVDDEEILAALKGAGREITSVDLAIEIGTITPAALTHRLHALAEKRLIARRHVPGGHSQTWL